MDPETYRQNFRLLLETWKDEFPELLPPAASWWQMWMQKYDHLSIQDTILQIAAKPKHPKTTEGIGKAISAILRDTEKTRVITEEMKRAGL